MKQRWKIRAFWIGLSLVVGAVAALLSRQGIDNYSENALKPPLTPPAALFPLVWTILYILMGWSAGEVDISGKSLERTLGLNLFVVQLTGNFFWSLLFFNAGAYGFSFFWLILLWGAILGMILVFRRIKASAGWLQLPYLLWVTFAGYLNWGVWRLNP